MKSTQLYTEMKHWNEMIVFGMKCLVIEGSQSRMMIPSACEMHGTATLLWIWTKFFCLVCWSKTLHGKRRLEGRNKCCGDKRLMSLKAGTKSRLRQSTYLGFGQLPDYIVGCRLNRVFVTPPVGGESMNVGKYIHTCDCTNLNLFYCCLL